MNAYNGVGFNDAVVNWWITNKYLAQECFNQCESFNWFTVPSDALSLAF